MLSINVQHGIKQWASGTYSLFPFTPVPEQRMGQTVSQRIAIAIVHYFIGIYKSTVAYARLPRGN